MHHIPSVKRASASAARLSFPRASSPLHAASVAAAVAASAVSAEGASLVPLFVPAVVSKASMAGRAEESMRAWAGLSPGGGALAGANLAVNGDLACAAIN